MADPFDVMDIPVISSDWYPLGDSQMVRTIDYEVDWCTVQLDQQIVAISPYGGPIAMTLDVRQAPPDTSGRLKEQPSIDIRTAAGRKLGVAQWTSASYIVGMGWDSKERLICVAENGQAFVYNVFGIFLSQEKIMPLDSGNERVVEVKFFNMSYGITGFAWRTGHDKFFACVSPEKAFRIKGFPQADEPSTCWCPVPVLKDREKQVVLTIVLAGGGKVFVLDPSEARVENVKLSTKSEPINWTNMCVDPTGRYLAMTDDKGLIWMGSSTLKKCYCEYTDDVEAIAGMAWINTKTEERGKENPVIAILKRSCLYVKGSGNSWHKFMMQGSSTMQQEVDGVRILSEDSYEFLQVVPEACQKVGMLGSMASGAVLLDAYLEYIKGDGSKAYECIEFVSKKEELIDAIEQCIGAATHVSDTRLQKHLMEASHFGRTFLKNCIPPGIVDATVTAGQFLRIINQLRQPEVGIPLTMTQLRTLTIKSLIHRIINRGLYPLALKFCHFLKFTPEEGEIPVLMHWAEKKITMSQGPSHEIARDIIERMKEYDVRVPYAKLAKMAKNSRKPELAKLLLSEETTIENQIPFLLEMGEFDNALDLATLSGDPHLILSVLSDLRRKRAADLPFKLCTRPEADALYKKYMADDVVDSIVRQARKGGAGGSGGRYNETEAANQFDDYYRASYSSSLNHEEKLKLVLKAKVAYNIEDTPGRFHEQAIRERSDLLAFQEREGTKKNLRLYGLSLFDTLVELFQDNESSLADKLAKQFKVSDKLYWQAKVMAFSDDGKWMDLERFSKSKKPPPIGFEVNIATSKYVVSGY
jgi:hypothetical protein